MLSNVRGVPPQRSPAGRAPGPCPVYGVAAQWERANPGAQPVALARLDRKGQPMFPGTKTVAGFLLAAVAMTLGRVIPPAVASDAAHLKQLIARLGGDRFKDREAAAKGLDAIGEPAL